MNVEEVSAFLRLDRKTVYKAVATRSIPHRKLGRRILFSRLALMQWLTGQTNELVATPAAARAAAGPQTRPVEAASTLTANICHPFWSVAGQRNSAQIDVLKTIVLKAIKDAPCKGALH